MFLLLFLFSETLNLNKCKIQLTKWTLEKKDKDAYQALSLYYRMIQSYYDEYMVVKRALKDHPDVNYFIERMQWHRKPMKDKIQKRRVNIVLNERMPKSDTLKNLCIVTGGDSNYFPMLIETIQSIKATRKYKNIPLIVIDGGLKEEEKNYLIKQFSVTLKNPEWPVHVSQNTPQYMKCVVLRPFFPEVLPGYRYYLWIDSDAWVNSEHAFDRHVCLAEDQGFAMCSENKRLYHFTLSTCLNWKDWSKIMWKKQINIGVFCVDSQSDFQKEWTQYTRRVFAEKGSNFLEKDGVSKMSDQHTATFILYKNGMRSLDNKENYCLRLFGMPVISSEDDILRDPQTLDPVGVVHLVHNKTARSKNNPVYYVPTKVCDKPLNRFELFVHRYFTKLFHYFRPEQIKILSSDKHFISWRFPVIQEDRNLKGQFQSLYLDLCDRYRINTI